jgi:hypothetical protein
VLFARRSLLIRRANLAVEVYLIQTSHGLLRRIGICPRADRVDLLDAVVLNDLLDLLILVLLHTAGLVDELLLAC